MGSAPSVVDRLWRWGLFVAYRLQIVYWFVFRPTEPSAHVAVWWQGEILIVYSPYRRHVSMPAGGIKRRESALEGARRELREEVGIAVEAEALKPAGLFVGHQQFKEDRAEVFELWCETEPEVVVDGREVIHAEFVAPRQVLEMHCSHVLRSCLERRDGASEGGAAGALPGGELA